MKAYIITIVVLQLLGAGLYLAEAKPKAFMQALGSRAFAVWGLWVIL